MDHGNTSTVGNAHVLCELSLHETGLGGMTRVIVTYSELFNVSELRHQLY